MRRTTVLLMAMAIAGPVPGQEHPACRDTALDGRQYKREELVKIARSCRSPVVAELYFNRAYHQRLLREYEHFERSLQHYGAQDHRAYIESYRIHIALAEAFAELRQPLDEQVIQRLNRIYEESGEIAEMRFRGYDLMADRLERQHRL